MKKVYGVLFLLIGIFNMCIGFLIYGSDYFKIMGFFNSFSSNSRNFLPLIIFAVGLLYTLIGLIMILKSSKPKVYSSTPKIGSH